MFPGDQNSMTVLVLIQCIIIISNYQSSKGSFLSVFCGLQQWLLLISCTASFCCITVPLLLGVAQALGVSSVYVSDPSLITKLLFPNHAGHANSTEPQLPRALSRAAPRRFLSFPQGKRNDSYHLSDLQLNNVITKVGFMESTSWTTVVCTCRERECHYNTCWTSKSW